MSKFKCVRAVLFDMDGLLLDTENLYTRGTQQVLSEFGKEYTWEFKAKLMGKRSDEVSRMMVDHYELPISPEEWVNRSQAIYRELFPSVSVLPGVTKLVHHLAKQNIPIAVATSSLSSAFDLKTKNHSGLFSLFDVIVKGDDPDVKRAKPEPDIFLVAAGKLDSVERADCLVVEDAPLGVEAGKSADMQVLMVPDARLDAKHTEKATHVVSSLRSFSPEIFGLPPYDYKPVTHVIFDMDGLLLNTMQIYAAGSLKLLEQHGKQRDKEFSMKVRGRRAPEAAQMSVDHYQLPYTADHYLKLLNKEWATMFPDCDILPGVDKLVRHLHANNVKMAVATSCARDIFQLKTSKKHEQFFSLFDHIVTGCDPEVVRGKPDPQIFEVARSRFSDSPEPGACLVFEDAPLGVEAGLGAGMQVVMVPAADVGKQHLVKATQAIPTMEEFQPEDFGLPKFLAMS